MFADPRRQLLLDLFARALEAVDGRRRVRAALAPLDLRGDWSVLAIGKAAASMTLGACDVLGDRLRRALVVSRDAHYDAALADRVGVELLVGDHPVPGPRSLAAGAAVAAFARASGAGQQVLVLISGGASSLVEALPAGVTLEELQRLNRWGLGAGVDIEALNALRRRLSLLKDGRLAALLANATTLALLLSDVPGDDPAVIGSGLVRAGEPCEIPVLPALPDDLAEVFARAGELPAGSSIPFLQVVGTLEDAIQAIQRAAALAGLTARRLPGRSDGEVTAIARRFSHELALGTTQVLCWGGESTIELPAAPGRGGRNQHLALTAALHLRGHDDLLLLAAGTDGSDGNTADAGAIVDGETLDRGREAGLDAERCLAHADSGRFLEGSGDLLHTGSTGTNVGDLLIGLRATASVAPDPGPPT